MEKRYDVTNQLETLEFDDLGRQINGLLDLDKETAFQEAEEPSEEAAAAVEALQEINRFGRREHSGLNVRSRGPKKVAIEGFRDEKDALEIHDHLEDNLENFEYISDVGFDKSLTRSHWAILLEYTVPRAT